MKNALLSALTVMILVGCASSSGALMIAQDTYTVSASASLGRGGTAAAKQIAYTEANAECARQKRTIDLIDEKVTMPSFFNGMYGVDIKFKCVAK